MKKVNLIILAVVLQLKSATGVLLSEQAYYTNKICFYKVMDSVYALNIKAYRSCPFVYDFDINN